MTILDLLATFDTVDHDLLLDILNKIFGISKVALQWFENYLRPRLIEVHVNKTYSNEKSFAFSVLQGSCSGANIFMAYCSPIGEIILDSEAISGFADDHLIWKSFLANSRMQEKEVINVLKSSMNLIKSWMDSMRLKLNSDKTEFILFGYRAQLQKCITEEINVNRDIIKCSANVKYLGGILDSQLTFIQHITLKCQIAMMYFIKIRNICKYLNKSAHETLLLALCISHLDYSNAILINLPDNTINKLQRIQNMCAKLILNKGKFDSVPEAMKELHWLPIKQRIMFKILTIFYKCTQGEAPNYLTYLLVKKTILCQGLRSNYDENKYIVPRVKNKTFADWSFSVAGPKLWNDLPEEIRNANSIESFIKSLKTYLFKEYFK